MRICSWNIRRASTRSGAWDLLLELAPDLALLQEVGSIPAKVSDVYQAAVRRAAGTKGGFVQSFGTAILVRGDLGEPINLRSHLEWVNRELEHFSGNLVAQHVTIRRQAYRVISVYSPAWPVSPERLVGIDVTGVKLKANPKVWVTELLYAALRDTPTDSESAPWIVGGDFNASETFDFGPRGPRGNREILDRMEQLGLIECLRTSNGQLVPTFRNPRGKQIVHQMDHLFVSASLAQRLEICVAGDHLRVFAGSLSDHLPITADFST